jgi:hypothetical protein
MTHDELRTVIAAIILGGCFSNENATMRDIEIHKAVLATDTLMEALLDPEPLKKRIAEWNEFVTKRNC